MLPLKATAELRSDNLVQRSSCPEKVVLCEEAVARAFPLFYPLSQGQFVPAICTLTRNGTVTVWTLNCKVKMMEFRTGVEHTSSVEFIFPTTVYPISALILHSRNKGIMIFKFNNGPLCPDNVISIPTTASAHAAFCTLQVFGDVLFFPYQQDELGMYNMTQVCLAISQNRAPSLMNIESTDGVVMCLKVVQNQEGEEFIVTGTEPGTVKVTTICRVPNDYGTGSVVFIRWNNCLNLNDYKKAAEDESESSDDGDISPICCEIFSKIDGIVVGTNSKYLYKLKMDTVKKYVSFDTAKRFHNKGINAMNLHFDGRHLATGSWDGCIRILAVPTLSQLIQITYHVQPINTIHFFNPFPEDSSSTFMFLAGSQDGQVSIWNPAEDLLRF